MQGQESYQLKKTIVDDGAVIRIWSPELDPVERSRRMKRIAASVEAIGKEVYWHKKGRVLK